MNALAYVKGVDVHVEDTETALRVDVTLPQRLTMSRVCVDLDDAVLRIVLPKSLEPGSRPAESAPLGHLIDPDASGV